MASTYIISGRGKLNKVGETLEFTSCEGEKKKIFPHKTDTLFITSEVSLTGATIRLMAKYEINAIFISKNGKLNGKLQFGGNKNVFLRQKQYRLADCSEKSLAIAKSIVIAKIKNQISMIQKIKRKENIESTIEKTVQSMKRYILKAEKCTEIETLRGIEGFVAKQYFSLFSFNLKPDWAIFTKRSKNPPRSNVNAVLSFLYTLLIYRVESAIESVGLDPMVGFLHSIEYGRNSLTFDLVEEFRAAIADRICFALFNLGILKPDDFRSLKELDSDLDEELSDSDENNTQNSEEEPIFLTEEGLKKVISTFEKKMNGEFLYSLLGKKLSFDQILIQQVNQMKRVINEEEMEYKGFFYK